MLDSLLESVLLLLRPDVFLMIGIGVLLGTSIGALPGFTTVMPMAVLLPVSFFLDPWSAFPT